MSVRISLRDVCVRLGGKLVLDRISLDVERGSFVTLLGPSGSGKTTALNVVAGFVRQESGHVRFDEEVVDTLPAHLREVGYVFQSYALFSHMTVVENASFALRARGVKRAERRRRSQRMLDLVQLGDAADRPVRTLSGGQQQRVALARALVFEPGLLLLDEPLAALDKQLRESMQVELKRIQRELGVTAIAVTHDQTEALTMSDRVAIVNEGSIEQVGSPEDVYRRPRTLFVARFLGEANLLAVSNSGEVAGLGVRLNDRTSGTAVLRPDDLGVAELGMQGDGRVPATVEEVVFQGVRYRVVVRAEGGAGNRYVLSLPADVGEDLSTLRGGARVNLVVDTARVHLIPETATENGESPDLAQAV